MSLAQHFSDALRELEGQLSTPGNAPSFGFGTRTIPCVPSPLAETIVIDAGNERQISLQLTVRGSNWLSWGLETIFIGDQVFDFEAGAENPPLVGQIISYPSQSRYRIHTIRRAPDNSFLVFDCVDPNSNR